MSQLQDNRNVMFSLTNIQRSLLRLENKNIVYELFIYV